MENNLIGDVLLQRYPGILRNIKSNIYDELSEAEIKKMPYQMNSIAWNIWHMARAEDVGMNRLVTEGVQVFDQDDWMERMNINVRHFGTGMTTDDVVGLSDTINVEALKAYQQAVQNQTIKIFEQLPQIELNEKLDKDHLHNVMIDEGVLHENALWVEEFYQTKIRSWFLVHMSLTHNFEHLGQIMLIRKLLGYKGSR